jgi:hypothetical protein
VGGIESNSGELGDLIWGNGDGGGRQLDAFYYRGLLGVRLTRIDDNSSQDREAKDCRPTT